MSIDAIRPRDVNWNDDHDASSALATKEQGAKTPDFSSSVFSFVHLPTGLLAAASRPTIATVRADARDVAAKADALLRDLRSPQIAEYVKSGAKLYEAYVKLNLCIGSLAKALYSVEHGELDKLLDTAKNGFDVPDKLAALVAAHHEFAKANGPKTNAACAQVARDAVSLAEAQAKLASDVMKSVMP